MPEYPEEVQEYINVLDDYTESDEVKEFDILHLYPGELAYPNGYYDARFFRLVGFNRQTKQKRYLGRHDAITMEQYMEAGRVYPEYPRVKMARIYADGSTLIQFDKPVYVMATQAAAVYYLPTSKEVKR